MWIEEQSNFSYNYCKFYVARFGNIAQVEIFLNGMQLQSKLADIRQTLICLYETDRLSRNPRDLPTTNYDEESGNKRIFSLIHSSLFPPPAHTFPPVPNPIPSLTSKLTKTDFGSHDSTSHFNYSV